MYPKKLEVLEFKDFYIPFSGKLDNNNRWVRLYDIIPWKGLEIEYAGLFSDDGAPAKLLQMALGALIIQNKCGFTDRETVIQIQENLYMQYFIGRYEFSNEIPFDPTMLVHFRKRLGIDVIKRVNELICKMEKKGIARGNDKEKTVSGDKPESEEKSKKEPPESNDGTGGKSEEIKENQGTLILDATCAPVDIKYPTDLNLLNEAREKLEEIIDILHFPMKGKKRRPGTHRQKARREYLLVAKNKKKSRKELRKAIGKQLRFVRRNLKIVEQMSEGNNLRLLKKKQYRDLLVINELYRQQKEMYDQEKHSIESRIVSISQPHVRPIVRGKAGADVEFGAKISISVVKGFSYLEKVSWENYNEGCYVKEQIETYKSRFGCYPAVVNADKIHRNRDNRKYCKEKSIRMSGPPLGRPPEMNAEETRQQKKTDEKDTGIRNAVEGSFGVTKRRYGSAQLMTKLKITSESSIALQFLVMNLEKRLRLLLRQFFIRLFFGKTGGLACV